jgi:hypothetical protein
MAWRKRSISFDTPRFFFLPSRRALCPMDKSPQMA